MSNRIKDGGKTSNQNNIKNKGKRKNEKLHLGDLLYYTLFSPQKPKVSKALRFTTHQALEPYYNFLTKAIKAEEQKANYEVNWKKIDSKFTIRLNPSVINIKIEKPKPYIEIDFTPELKKSIKEEKNRLIFNDQDKMETFNKELLLLDDYTLKVFSKRLPQHNESIELNGIDVKYKIKNTEINQNSQLVNKNSKQLDIKTFEILDDGWNISIDASIGSIEKLYCSNEELQFKIYPRKNFEKLYDEVNTEIKFEKLGNDFSVESLPNSKIIKTENGDEYHWYKVSKEKEEFVIQLIDDDSIDEKPVSEYFFDDEVSEIYQNKPQDSYKIKRKKFEEKILILQKPYKNEIKLEKDIPIKIVVNTANLKRQQQAIKLLNNNPIGAQRQLIKLFERKDQNRKLWNKPSKIEIDNWYILKDNSYDGTNKQQEFVQKAMATRDFAILEGPPGSGKTTAILELILQLAKKGKTILLSASTHVAIDNVLERIKEKDTDNLIEPLRIGDDSRIDEAVKEYQIDNKIKKYTDNGMNITLAERLTLDSANLVCGTTMGIQRHPDMNRIFNKDDDRKYLPITPKYDYMIIDESSKTTFQEFLVPALYAKKWILVGDIKQLSPYIEQTHIVHNLRESIPYHTQKAIRLIFETLSNNINPYVIEIEKEIIQEAKKYWEYWGKQEKNPYKDKIIFFIEKDNREYDSNFLYNLLASDVIFIEKDLWNSYKQFIPKTHIVIRDENNESDDFLFKQLYLNRKRQLPKYKQINKEFLKTNNPIEYSNIFKEMIKEKDWAEEIAWRMIRVYERRMLKNPDSYYEKSFELLNPVKEKNPVKRIYNMTLPSILESIQTGNGEKHRNSTTITDGFDKTDLEERHVTLDYQHRMHPEISKFSREQFYTTEGTVALKDSPLTNRDWNYTKYNSRNIWIDIPKKDTSNDRRHIAEVKRTIKELESFIDFATNNPHPTEEKWTVGIITFYRPQESLLREELRQFCNLPHTISRFHKNGIEILNYTVDKFQGMEADIIFLNMVRGKSIGFLDNINRLNVALTRARFQRVILGDKDYFAQKQNNSEDLTKLAQSCEVIK